MKFGVVSSAGRSELGHLPSTYLWTYLPNTRTGEVKTDVGSSPRDTEDESGRVHVYSLCSENRERDGEGTFGGKVDWRSPYRRVPPPTDLGRSGEVVSGSSPILQTSTDPVPLYLSLSPRGPRHRRVFHTLSRKRGIRPPLLGLPTGVLTTEWEPCPVLVSDRRGGVPRENDENPTINPLPEDTPGPVGLK